MCQKLQGAFESENQSQNLRALAGILMTNFSNVDIQTMTYTPKPHMNTHEKTRRHFSFVRKHARTVFPPFPMIQPTSSSSIETVSETISSCSLAASACACVSATIVTVPSLRMSTRMIPESAKSDVKHVHLCAYIYKHLRLRISNTCSCAIAPDIHAHDTWKCRH